MASKLQQQVDRADLDGSMSSWVSAPTQQILSDSSPELRPFTRSCRPVSSSCTPVCDWLRSKAAASFFPRLCRRAFPFLDRFEEALAAVFRVSAERPSDLASSLDKRAVADMFDDPVSSRKRVEQTDPEESLIAVLEGSHQLLSDSDINLASEAIQQMEQRALES
eukprot:704836-Hanusia_phi.AAC.7